MIYLILFFAVVPIVSIVFGFRMNDVKSAHRLVITTVCVLLVMGGILLVVGWDR